MIEYLRIMLVLICFAICAGAILTGGHYIALAGEHARQRIKGSDFLGPFIFGVPAFYDEEGRGKRIGQNLLLSIVVFVVFALLAILIGEV